MSLVLNGAKYSKITLTGDRALESWQADITAPEMQKGRTALVKGELVVGTGKAFEFAEYGTMLVSPVVDSEGVTKYGRRFPIGEDTNVIFIAPTDTGDIVLQTDFLVKIGKGDTVSLGKNHSTGGEVYASHDGEYLTIFLTDFSKEKTLLRYFVGKDNEI